MFFIFSQVSAGSFIYLNDGSGNFGNLSMNGDLMLSVSSGYMFYVLVAIVSFLFYCRDTREGMLVC